MAFCAAVPARVHLMIRGSDLEAVAGALDRIIEANARLTEFHRRASRR